MGRRSIPPPPSPASPPGAAKPCWPTSRSAARAAPRSPPTPPNPSPSPCGVSPVTAKQLITDALELRHRLPETWKRVAALEVPAWKGRHVAVLTHTLSLRPPGGSTSRSPPGCTGAARRPSTPSSPTPSPSTTPPGTPNAKPAPRSRPGTSPCTPRPRRSTPPPASCTSPATPSSSPTSTASLSRDAVAAGKAGDDQPLGVRKVHALATLFTGAQAATLTGGRAASEASDQSRPPPQTVLYLHLDKTDLDDDDLVKIGRAERLGPVTTDKIRDWLGNSHRPHPAGDPDGRRRRRQRPRPTRPDPRPGHPPRPDLPLPRLPGRFTGSCDLDHVIPYDPAGPPGQTRPSNLVPLCRRHHNAKTTGLWRYTRTPSGVYELDRAAASCGRSGPQADQPRGPGQPRCAAARRVTSSSGTGATSSDGTQHDRSVRHASGGGVASRLARPRAAGGRTPPARRCAA